MIFSEMLWDITIVGKRNKLLSILKKVLSRFSEVIKFLQKNSLMLDRIGIN